VFAPSEAASGVDQSAALDSYVAAAQSTIPSIMDQSKGMYSKIQILGTHPDAVEFVYTYLNSDGTTLWSHLFEAAS
jgi:hypothetical protein